MQDRPPDEMDELIRRIWPDRYQPCDLHPELIKATQVRDGETWLHHRFRCDVYTPESHAWLNQEFDAWKEKLADAILLRNWEDFIQLHAEPFWIDALEEVEGHATPRSWAATVRYVWEFSHVMWKNAARWREVLPRAKPIIGFMTPEEHEALRAMKNPLTIFRGCRREFAKGLSWTLNRDQARVFAHNARPVPGSGIIVTGQADPARVLALFNSEEQEIVIRPEDVTIIDPPELR